jgi:hypothetical protein
MKTLSAEFVQQSQVGRAGNELRPAGSAGAPGRIRTRDPLLRRYGRTVAGRRHMWPDVQFFFLAIGWMWPEIAWRLSPVAPQMAPRNLVSQANIRTARARCRFSCRRGCPANFPAGRTWDPAKPIKELGSGASGRAEKLAELLGFVPGRACGPCPIRQAGWLPALAWVAIILGWAPLLRAISWLLVDARWEAGDERASG